MFQRLKGAIDARIAEEQARQKGLQESPSRSNSRTQRRPRHDSSSRDRGDPLSQPDPAEFDKDINEEAPSSNDEVSILSRNAKENSKSEDIAGEVITQSSNATMENPDVAEGSQISKQPVDLPLNVRVKLRKLEKLETRYQDLLRSYRIAHGRAMAVESFEVSLRENTPLASIKDTGAFVEYLSQINAKGDMVLQELKRVSAERDEYKLKAEKLERSNDSIKEAGYANEKNENSASSGEKSDKKETADNTDEFFSYDSELPRLEAEVKAREEDIVELNAEIKTLKNDLAVTRESTEGMASRLESATKELITLREENAVIKKQSEEKFSQSQTEKADEVNDEKNSSSAELISLQEQLRGSSQQLERLQAKMKIQDDLEEEIESLRDDVTNFGQDLVTAKDTVKELRSQKTALENNVTQLEAEVAALTLKGESAAMDKTEPSIEVKNGPPVTEDDSKAKVSALQTELSASQNLAAARYKDLTELRTTFQRAQPEIMQLKADLSKLKDAKSDLDKKSAEFTSLEAQVKKLELDLSIIKSKREEQESEIRVLNDKVKQEINQRSKVENLQKATQMKLKKAEADKATALASAEQTSTDLRKIQDAASIYRSKIRELEDTVARLGREVASLKEEIEMKSAQQTSAQSLISSMRDQTAEMGMQVKEVRERGESLEEELSDAHRLLSERSREGETMRRLLADVEGRANAKVREMKERLDIANEERDRAEDEASTIGRKKSREIDELKLKARDAERALARALDDKEDLLRAERDWKRRGEELETNSRQSVQEIEDVKTAMTELREALDESEKQVTTLDQQRTDLRTATIDMKSRLEKLQKTNKSLSEELKSIQSNGTQRAAEPEALSPRTSSDSSPRMNIGLANGQKENDLPKTVQQPATGQSTTKVDYVYLKNVLLQFLEQKDKKHQMQLIPVLGMLLHFDRKDEQKWTSAITAR